VYEQLQSLASSP